VDDTLTGPSPALEPIVAADGEAPAGPRVPGRWHRSLRSPWLPVVALTLAAGVGYGWNLVHFGVNYYYAAAANTMAHSWTAFWFGGYDPTGTVTVDKLPGGLWLQALSIRLFGLSTPSLVAPMVIAGALCVPAVFVAARRLAGYRVALAAAAILAVTPATGVMSRGNTQDVFCVLLLILATGAATTAIRAGTWRPLILSAVYVGLAFQFKMLEAWVVLPGFALAYLLAAPGSAGRRLGRLTAGLAVMVVVSLSWMAAVSLSPAADRPYVDGSQHNSVFEQVFIYNGTERFTKDPAYGLGSDLPYHPTAAQVALYHDLFDNPAISSGSDPGWSRLLLHGIGRDAGWLLPTALVMLGAGIWLRRRRPRTDMIRAGLIAWGSWLVIYTVALSSGRILLSYYTGMLVAPIAVITAVGLRMLWRRLTRRDIQPGRRAALVGAVAAIAGVECLVAYDGPGWLPATAALGGLTAVITLTAAAKPRPAGSTAHRWHRIPVVIATLGLLAGPAASTAHFLASSGGEWDSPQAARGTYAQQLRQMIDKKGLTGLSTSSVYGSVYMPETNQSTWHSFVVGRAFFDAVPPGRSVLVFTGAEASAWLLTGAPNIRVVGGYTGYAPAPSLATVRAWITGGSVQWAIVPASGEIRANDPRVLLIKDLCSPQFQYGSLTGLAPIIYRCDRLRT
jgi:4-amino-4-deoxy-L-arabinose transferase-like glycosyltransferase